MPMPNDTKQKLEMQALHFFAAHDYERSSLNDIAQALGVTKGAIYHYFPSKDALFKASISRLLDTMGSMFAATMAPTMPLRPLMEGLFDIGSALEDLGEASGLGDFLTAYENAFYLFLAGVKKFPDLQVKLDRIYAVFTDSLEAMLRNAIESGDVRPDTDVEAVAYEITAFYEGALLLGAFTSKKDYLVLGPRVCASILDRIETDEARAAARAAGPDSRGTWGEVLKAAHRTDPDLTESWGRGPEEPIEE